MHFSENNMEIHQLENFVAIVENGGTQKNDAGSMGGF